MAFQITSLDSTAPKHVFMLLMGLAGAGKSYSFGTLPADKTLIIDAENGLLGLNGTGMHSARFEQASQLAEMIQFLKSADAQHYEYVCVDSISEISKIVLLDQKSKNSNQLQAYGKAQDIVDAFIRELRDLQKHVIVTCKVQKSEDIEGRTNIGALMSSKSQSAGITFDFDEVLFLRNERTNDGQISRYFQTQRCEKYDAKDRSGKLDQYEAPNLFAIIQKILGA